MNRGGSAPEPQPLPTRRCDAHRVTASAMADSSASCRIMKPFRTEDGSRRLVSAVMCELAARPDWSWHAQALQSSQLTAPTDAFLAATRWMPEVSPIHWLNMPSWAHMYDDLAEFEPLELRNDRGRE